jgi:hypothetical protein
MEKFKQVLGAVIAVPLIVGILWFGSATGLLRAVVGHFWKTTPPSPTQAQAASELPPFSADELHTYSRTWAKAIKEPLSESDISALENTYRAYMKRIGLSHFSEDQVKYLTEKIKLDYDYNHELETCLLMSATFKSPNISPEFKRLSARLTEMNDDKETKEQVESETKWIVATAKGEPWTDSTGGVHEVMTREKALRKLHDFELLAPNFDRLAEMFQRLGAPK